MLFAGLLAMTLMTTSVGGAFASSVQAATPGEVETDSVASHNNKGLIGGLIAVGIIAAIASKGGSDKGSSDTSNRQNSTSNNTGSTTTTPTTSTTVSGLTAEEQQALKLLNADRAAKGLSALKANLALTGLAENYAQDMINRGYFSHYNPEGQSPFDRMKNAGISYNYAGENLAINTDVTAAETAFMNSSGHRANILNANYTEVGIGVRHDSKGSAYVVQEFIGK